MTEREIYLSRGLCPIEEGEGPEAAPEETGRDEPPKNRPRATGKHQAPKKLDTRADEAVESQQPGNAGERPGRPEL